MKEKIFRRLIVDDLTKYLTTDDVLVIHGARQVGKTYTLFYLQNLLEEKGKKTAYFDLEDSRFVQILDAGVENFIKHLKEEGLVPLERKKNGNKLFVFIDEIQYLENPSSFLKIIADHHPELKLIVSGSSSFQIKKKFKDSLVGRTVNFELYPLSFKEFLTFKGISFAEKHVYTSKKIDELKSFYEEFALCGGYPKIVLTPDVKMKEKYLQQIIDTYIRKDIRDLAEIKDINKFNRLIEVLSSQSGQLLNVMELSNTCKIAKQTIEHYLFLLEQTYIVRLVRPYSSNLRSELSKTPKIFFYDTGLMQMLWLKGLPKEVLGPVFETSLFGELVKKHGPEKICFWRTTDKKEIDFVLKDKGGLLPLEAKLNFAQIRLTAIGYFLNKYKTKNYKIVGLKGDRKNKHYCYPWEI